MCVGETAVWFLAQFNELSSTNTASRQAHCQSSQILLLVEEDA